MKEFAYCNTRNPGTATILGDGDVALGVIHSLARAGIGISHIYTNPSEHAHHSRFVQKGVLAPSPDDSTSLLECLKELGRKHPGSCLIPCSDDLVLFTARNRESLRECFRPAVPPLEALEQIIDKAALCNLSVSLGIPAAKTWMPASVDELNFCLDEITFPCILKPSESHRFFKVYKRKLLVIQTRDELVEAFRETLQRGISVMVSEIITGDDSSLYHYRSFMNKDGRIVGELCTQKLRQHPAGFGVASYSRTVPMKPELREMTLSLLRNLGYRGFSSAEYKLDGRDGRFKLVEINVRPVLPERLFAEAGVNFCQIACTDNSDMESPSSCVYETEIYWVHNFFEIIRLVYHRNLNLKDFLQPYWKKRLVKCVPFFYDPVPFITRIRGFLGEQAGLIFKRK